LTSSRHKIADHLSKLGIADSGFDATFPDRVGITDGMDADDPVAAGLRHLEPFEFPIDFVKGVVQALHVSSTLNRAPVVDEIPKAMLCPTVEGKDCLELEGTVFADEMNRLVRNLVRGRDRVEKVDDAAFRAVFFPLFTEGYGKADPPMKITEPSQVALEDRGREVRNRENGAIGLEGQTGFRSKGISGRDSS